MDAVFVVVTCLAAIAAYFAPTIIAVWRQVPNSVSMFVINLLLGWSVIGWIVALAMACRTKPRPVTAPPQVTAITQSEAGEQGSAHA